MLSLSTIRSARIASNSHRRKARSLASVALVVGSLVLVSSASADPASGPGLVTRTTAGAVTPGMVPDGSCAARVTALGGGGASSPVNAGFGGTGGAGAQIAATFDVLPGQSYGGSVGGGGSLPTGGSGNGSVGAGGTGGTITEQHRGGGGGGSTSVDLAGTMVVVAGGGGGGGAAHQTAPAGVGGGGGFAGIAAGIVAVGSNGQAGVDIGATAGGGQGGQAAAGGAGGVNTTNATLNGAAGGGVGVGTGGNGGPDPNYDSAGGGGGGYTGGGGGSSTVDSNVSGAGGGGGSSWVRATSPTTVGNAPTAVSGSAGPASPAGRGSGATGSASIDWLPCLYRLNIDKTVSSATVNAGGAVTWTISITNLGPDAMTRGDTVTLTDLLPDGPNGGPGPDFEVTSFSVSGGSNAELSRGPITCTGLSIGTSMPASTTCSRAYSAPSAPEAPSGGQRGLDVGETITIAYRQVIANTAPCGTITNTATVSDRATTTGTTDVVGVVAQRSDSESLTIDCYDLAVVKTVSPSPVRPGRDLTWSVTVTNLGPAAMEGPADTEANPLVVTDVFPNEHVGAAVLTASDGPANDCELSGSTVTCQSGLAAGEQQVLTFTQAVDVDAPAGALLANSASVTDPTADDDNDSDSAEATVGSVGLALTKLADPLSFSAVGDVISYSYLVENTGTVPLAGPVTVDDDRASVTCPPVVSLEPGATVTCTATYTISQQDLDTGSVTNHATASADGVTSPEDTATVTGSQGPAMVLVKHADRASYGEVGEVISYTYVVTNTGNVTLPGPFSIDDDRTDDTSCPQIEQLVPGEQIVCEATYVVTQDDLDAGSITNVASATNGEITSNQDSVTVTSTPSAAISLVKTALRDDLPAAGETVGYEYAVTNTGNVSLAGPVTVTDDKVAVVCPDLSTVGDGDDALDPGETIVCTSTYTVTAADVAAGSVTNIASAAAGGVLSGVASATVDREGDMPDTVLRTAGPWGWVLLLGMQVLIVAAIVAGLQARSRRAACR